jgi:hypothetical protein
MCILQLRLEAHIVRQLGLIQRRLSCALRAGKGGSCCCGGCHGPGQAARLRRGSAVGGKLLLLLLQCRTGGIVGWFCTWRGGCRS